MSRTSALLEIRLGTAKILGGRCGICKRRFKTGGFAIHHFYYIPSDKIYSDFESGIAGKLSYHKHLQRMVKRNPKRFTLLCSKHHYALETLLMWNEDNLKRLQRLVRKTRSLQNKHNGK